MKPYIKDKDELILRNLVYITANSADEFSFQLRFEFKVHFALFENTLLSIIFTKNDIFLYCNKHRKTNTSRISFYLKVSFLIRCKNHIEVKYEINIILFLKLL